MVPTQQDSLLQQLHATLNCKSEVVGLFQQDNVQFISFSFDFTLLNIFIELVETTMTLSFYELEEIGL
jgi:hypothetical protein